MNYYGFYIYLFNSFTVIRHHSRAARIEFQASAAQAEINVNNYKEIKFDPKVSPCLAAFFVFDSA